MAFPRKANGSLDFETFNGLSKEAKKEAFLDLKANGSVEEKKAYQANLNQLKAANNEKLEAADVRIQALEQQKNELLLQRKKIVHTQVQQLDTDLLKVTTNTQSTSKKKLFRIF